MTWGHYERAMTIIDLRGWTAALRGVDGGEGSRQGSPYLRNIFRGHALGPKFVSIAAVAREACRRPEALGTPGTWRNNGWSKILRRGLSPIGFVETDDRVWEGTEGSISCP